MIKPILDQPILPEEINDSYNKLQTVKDFPDSDVIVHGYIKKLGGPFTSAWQTKYGKLYPSRLELYPESMTAKPEVKTNFR